MEANHESDPLVCKDQVDGDHKRCTSGLSKRWQLSAVMFFGVFFLYSLRVNLSVAVVCMVNSTSENSSDNSNIHSNSSTTGSNAGEFDWTKSTVNGMLSSYYYGYIVLQIPGGWLASRFGGKRVIAFAMLISSLATIFLPIATRANKDLVYVLRVVLGLFASMTYPACQSMWGRWAPPLERTKLSAVAFSGGSVGAVLTFAASGFLCSSDGGWPSIFYVTGSLALLWTLVWFWLIYDSPSTHPTISQEERDYIIASLEEKSQKTPPTPWRGMLSSSPFWALMVAIVGSAWINYIFLSCLPQYMKDVLHFDIDQNGILTSLPYVGEAVSGLLSGQVADIMRNRGITTRTTRVVFQCSSYIGIAASLLGVGFITEEHRYIAVGLLAISGLFVGLTQAGYIANFVDIGPRFCGIMYGIGNCLATVPGFVTPLMVAAMTQDKTQQEWQRVFYVCIGVCLFATLVYSVFAGGNVQAWAIVEEEARGDEEEDNDDEGLYGEEKKTGNSVFKRSINT